MSTEKLIQEQISTHPLIIYMKGTPEIPMCGFSAKAVAILKSYGIPFAHINILDYPEIRATLPKMMNWPTFPQIYVNGELIGGCDILVELHETSELKDILSKVHVSKN
jgi:monothiol glutaredoxin